MDFLGESSDAPAMETNFNTLMQSGNFRNLFAGLDETLAADPKMEKTFDDFFDHLAKNPDTRQAVETIREFEFRNRARPAVAPAMKELRAFPDQAIDYLRNPGRMRPMTPDLVSAMPVLHGNETNRQSLLQAFGQIQANPDAAAKVYPYWKATAAGGDSLDAWWGSTARNPMQFWAWHRRSVAQASDPQSRDWTRHLQRLVRRNPALASTYDGYVETVRKNGARQARASKRWTKQRGSAAPWPPRTAPPRLAPLATTPIMKIAGPTSPTIARPVAPTRPIAPIESPQSPTTPSAQVPNSPSTQFRRKTTTGGEARTPLTPRKPLAPLPPRAPR
jgi:hypothetical protein